MFAIKGWITVSILWGAFCSGALAQDDAQVQGLLATRVQFSAEAGEKVSAAMLKLLTSCTASASATESQLQDAPTGTCHLHFTFTKPRIIAMANSQALSVDELVVTFPLSSARLWVRSGDQYHWFAKFRPDLCDPIQELLKETVPSERGR